MKIVNYVISAFSMIGIIFYIITLGLQSMKVTSVSTNLSVKQLKSSELLEFFLVDNESKEIKEDREVEQKDVVSEKKIETSISQGESLDTPIVEEVSTPISDVLESREGSLSGYGPDCSGCSGYLASGLDVRGGNIYYQDTTYGKVRILSGDKSYPYGTIVRVRNSKLSEFIGIVLDRGGSVGIGKKHLFDLLYPTSSEALNYGTSYQVTFEILRYGY